MSSVFKGQRDKYQNAHVWIEVDGERKDLKNVAPHKSQDFEWGFSGSGPTCLAMSMIFAALKSPEGSNTAAHVRDELLADLGEEWEIPFSAVLDSISRGRTVAGNFDPATSGHAGEDVV